MIEFIDVMLSVFANLMVPVGAAAMFFLGLLIGYKRGRESVASPPIPSAPEDSGRK